MVESNIRLSGFPVIAPKGVFALRKFSNHKDDTGQRCEDRDRPCSYCDEIERVMDSPQGNKLVDHITKRLL